jgi:hypothetical protein
MLICSECKNKEPCISEEEECRAVFCAAGKNQTHHPVIRCEWREYLPGDELYMDPMGQRYHGITQHMQTPIIDPLRPATAAEIMMRKKTQEIPPNPGPEIKGE